MRYLYLVGILCFVFIQPSEAQWKLLLPEKTFGFTANPKNPNTLLVGGADGKMYRSYNKGATWDTVKITEPSFMNPQKLTNIFYNLPDTTIIIIGGINYFAIDRSTDNGTTWRIALEGRHPIEMIGESLIRDPHIPEVFYAAHYILRYILKSTSGGDFWREVCIIDGNEYLSTIAIMPDGRTFFAGLDSGVIRKSTDEGISWREVANFTNKLYAGEVTSIVFSKKNPWVGYAVMTYTNSNSTPNGGLYKTVNSGESWYKIGFTDTSLRTIALRTYGYDDDVYVGGLSDPMYPSKAIPGAGIVSHSTNGGISWERIDKSIEWTDTLNRNIWSMKFVEDTPENENLYMATEGGFYVMDVPVSVREQEPEQISDDWNVRLENGKLTIKTPKNYNSTTEYTVRLFTLLGEKTSEENLVGNNEIEIKNYQTGVYLCEIIEGQQRKKFFLIAQ